MLRQPHIEKLLDYVINTPEDGLSSEASVRVVTSIIDKNLSIENYNAKAYTQITLTCQAEQIMQKIFVQK